MIKLSLPALITCLAFLSGCNGSSGSNDAPVVQEPAVVNSISLELFDGNGNSENSFIENSTITVQATVRDQFNQPVSGSRVNFSIDLGELSVPSSLTNSDGIAITNITNENEILSAGTASATIEALNDSTDYEYINSGNGEQENQISTLLLLNGDATNQFKSNENVQVQILLTDAIGAPIANEIINFNANIGVLSTATALTSDTGLASVTLYPFTDLDFQTIELGAGIVSVSMASNTAISTNMNYQIVAANTIIDEVKIGHFDDDNTFIEGVISLSIDTISAGGTLGLEVNLVDQNNVPIVIPTQVNFTSSCVGNEKANIDESVLSIKGIASATFEDIRCAGSTGTSDVIIASVILNDGTVTATGTIEISGEQLGSIEFVSAEPALIVLKGSGGQENSTVTFLVKSALGNPLAQQEVEFSLDNNISGLTLSREKGLTNSQGLITTQVSSGNTPVVIRITAQATMEISGESHSVQTQSNQLSINTGLPEQASITIGATILNPAINNGTESIVRVWLSDSFNNPVPDGTTVNFTAEGGSIGKVVNNELVGGGCNTIGGTCFVTWTSTEPVPADHRVTILATASGHETFFDTNGNNIFDEDDGLAIINNDVSSGFGRQLPLSSGFIDLSEAWRDDNENFVRDANETTWFDDNGDGLFSAPDGKFNGPQCEGSLCDANTKKVTLRKAMVLVMSSGSNPRFILSNDSQTITYQDESGITTNLPTIADDSSLALDFRFADSALQTLPIGSTVEVTIDGASLQGTTSYAVGNTSVEGYKTMEFTVVNEAGNTSSEATLQINISTPNTLTTTYINRTITLL